MGYGSHTPEKLRFRSMLPRFRSMRYGAIMRSAPATVASRSLTLPGCRAVAAATSALAHREAVSQRPSSRPARCCQNRSAIERQLLDERSTATRSYAPVDFL